MRHHNTMEEQRNHMLTDPVSKLILQQAVPCIGSMLVNAIYNLADTFFVGTLGNSATGAVGIVFPVTTLLQALAFIFAHGGMSCISRELGKGDGDAASKTASTVLICDLILGAVYGLMGFLFMDHILRLFGATETILPYAQEYAPWLYASIACFAGSAGLNNILRAEGKAKQSLIGMSAGPVLNIILDPIFIFVFDLGVAGAGIATMIGQIVSFVVLLSFFFMKDYGSNLKLRFSNFAPQKLPAICAVGIPSFFRQGLNSFSAILLNNMAGPYGDVAIAALSVVSRVTWIVCASLIGFSHGYQPINGYNQGAGRMDRCYDALKFTLTTAFIFGCTCGLLMFGFAKPLIGLFRDDPAVIELGARVLRTQCCTFAVVGVVTVFVMYFQTAGRAAAATFMAMCRQGICFIPMVLLLPTLFGIDGLVFVQAASDVLALLVTLPFTMKAVREAKNAAAQCGN